MFVDIHNHLLPGVDDGALDMDTSLAMARLAVAGGTDIMVATPHRAWQSRKDAPPAWVREKVQRLQAVIDKEDIPLTVLAGVELQVGPLLAQELVSGKVSALGTGNWALIELPFDHLPDDALDHLRAVRDAGFEIVLAHPERNAVIQRSLGFLESCVALGMAFQVTTGSILGRLGPRPQKTAHTILTRFQEWPLVIASDMHDVRERPPNWMAAARDAATALIGSEQAAHNMVNSRPRAIVSSTITSQDLLASCQ